MEQTSSENRFWTFFVGSVILVIMVAAILWSKAHPYGLYWDEANYLNEVAIDLQRLQAGKLLTLGRGFLINQSRPPAYRLLALPFLAVFGFHVLIARLVSVVCFSVSAWFVYLATSRIAGRVSGAIAALIFSLSPEVIAASIVLGTDAPLYLATSAMLYYLFLCWIDGPEHSGNWIGLGLAVGLGFLSKASFIVIAVPVLALCLFYVYRTRPSVPAIKSFLKAGVLAFVIAGPWWLLNYRNSRGQVQHARQFVRHSLGPPSFTTFLSWLNTVWQGLLGHGTSILIGLIVMTFLGWIIAKKELGLEPVQKMALWACACAGLPIVFAQLSGTNHELRHISPAVIPFAIAIGVLSAKTGWGRSEVTASVSCILFCAQLVLIVAPVGFPNDRPADLGFINGTLPWRVMVRSDQWDWSPLPDMAHDCGLETPKISYLGLGRGFNEPDILYFWIVRGKYADVKWLWRYEEGPPDWGKIMDLAGQSDFCVTAPGYIGAVKNREDLDNQYNTEFVSRLSQDPRFRGPIRLKMGRFESIEVDVFIKNTVKCQFDQQPPRTQ